LLFEIWIFRIGQPYRDDDRIFFVAMILTYDERSFVWVAIVLAAELCLEISVLGSSSGKTYEL
jgi:hypothetical protein